MVFFFHWYDYNSLSLSPTNIYLGFQLTLISPPNLQKPDSMYQVAESERPDVDDCLKHPYFWVEGDVRLSNMCNI